MRPKFTSVAVFALLCLASPALSADLYVVASGGSGTACTSGSPCTLATANGAAVAGDTIIMAAGTYTTGINPTNSGNTQFANPITYTVASGATVIIRANRCIDLTGGEDSITIQKGNGTALILDDPGYRYIDAVGNQYITIDGVRTTGADSAVQWSACHFQTVRYLVIKNCSFASDDSTTNRGYDFVHFKDVKYFDVGPNNTFGDSPHGILYIAKSCRYGRVHSNTHNNFWRHGMNIEDAYTITGADNLSPRDILIEDNFFDRTGSLSSSNPWLDDRGRVAHSIENGGSQTIIRNNIFYKTHSNIEYFCQAGKTVQNNYYYHNTGYKPTKYVTDSLSGLNSYTNMYGTLSNNRILNNIFSEAQGDYTWRWLDQGGSQSGNQITNNIIYPDTTVRTFRFQWFANIYTTITALNNLSDFDGNINSNPLLNAPDNADFSLQAGSPAIGAASFLATIQTGGVSGTTFTLGTNEGYAFAPSDWGVPNFYGDFVYNQSGTRARVTGRTANTITVDSATGFSAGDTLTTVPFTGSAPDMGVVASDLAPPGEAPIYTGWFNNSGTPTTDPSAYGGMAADRTYLRKVTATSDGTAYSVRVFIDSVFNGTAWAVAYKMNGTTLELIGYAAITSPTLNTWTTELILQEPASEDMSFSSGDDLYFGIAGDPTSEYSIRVGREDTGGTGLYWSTKAFSGAPHAELLAGDMETPSTGRDMAFVLGYTVADDTGDPVVTITSPTANATYNSPAGANTINLSGTSSDAGSYVTSITWADNHGNSGSGSITDPWATWSINGIVLAAGSTEITVTATDAYENTSTDTITVTFVGPTGSLVGWDSGDNPPNGAITSSALIAADRIYLRAPWTATGGGDIAGLYWYAGDAWAPTRAWVVAYRVSGAQYVLVAQTEITSVALSSYNYLPFSNPVSGQSLRFAENDQLVFGIAFDVGAGLKYGGNTTGGSGLLFYEGDLSTGPVNLTIATDITTTASYDPGFTMVYTTLPGDTTAPSVAITTPSDAVSIVVSTYTIAGTASDETALDYVIWSCSESEYGGTLSVSDGAWSSLIELVIGDNTIKTRAYDTSGNYAEDTVVITQTWPTVTCSGSFSN